MEKKIIVFIIFLISSIYITFPLIFHLGDYTTGLGDEMVIAWIQNWVIHALTTNPLSLFNANIYYPYENSLAFSDVFITSSILSFPILKIINEPIAAVNFTFISSLTMLGFSIYLLCFYLTRNFLASILSGILVVFSPAVLDKAVHLQILSIQWVPLSILFFIIFLKRYQTRYLMSSLAFFVLQTYNSFLPGYFIVLSYIVILLFFLWNKKLDLKRLFSIKNGALFAITVILIALIAIPYYKVSHQFNYTRDIRDAIHFALQPEDFYYPSQYTRLQQPLFAFSHLKKYPQNASLKPGYIGAVFSILTLFTLFVFIKKIKRNDFLFNAFSTISLLGLVLSLGPALHLERVTIHKPFPIILPYALFYHIVPGFQGFRNSARWEMLFIIFVSVAVSMLLSKLLKKHKPETKTILYILLIFLVVIEFNFPMKFVKVPQISEFPKVYSWLATTPEKSKIIELPIYNWNMWPGTQNELLRQYYSTIHFRKMVNGYSGFSPPPWQALVTSILSEFPSDKSIENLRKIGITYIIIHKDEYDFLNKSGFKVNNASILDGNAIIEQAESTELKFIKKLDGTYIYGF